MPARLRLTLLAAFLFLAFGWGATRAQSTNRAGLVVQFGNGEVVTACIEFTEATINGSELLQQSGVQIITEGDSGYGFAICKISDGLNSDGCDYPLDDCFCQCTGADCRYWAYYHLQGNEWRYSDVGGSGWELSNGMVDGWAWGPGTINESGVMPPVYTFDQICAPPATPTDTPTPTSIPPSATPTTAPTPTPTTLPTPAFTPTPTARPRLIVDFALMPQAIVAGDCANLSWRVEGADSADLKVAGGAEQRVTPIATLRVCPTADTLYELVVRRSGEAQTFAQTLRVAPATTTPTTAATATATSTATLTPTPLPGATPTPIPTATLVPTLTPTPTPMPPPVTPTLTATNTSVAVVPAASLTPTPTSTSDDAIRPVRILTPTPKSAESSGGGDGRLLRIGSFVLIVALLIAAGLFALGRQGHRQP